MIQLFNDDKVNWEMLQNPFPYLYIALRNQLLYLLFIPDRTFGQTRHFFRLAAVSPRLLELVAL